MRWMHCPESSLLRPRWLGRSLGTLGVVMATLVWSCDAAAHFTLISPPSWVVEDGLGNPQKVAPCGGDNVDTTGEITTYRAGSTISVQWQETVGHPGHFRISLAADRADLVDPPVFTTSGDGVSGESISARIDANPAKPVLLDGLFVRTGSPPAQEAPFQVAVRLPNETCEKCTLQVIQFMSKHLPTYFYHHCADLKIVAADAVLAEEPPGVLEGPGGGTGTSSGSRSEDEESGGCSLAPRRGSTAPSSKAPLLLLLIGAALLRRRFS